VRRHHQFLRPIEHEGHTLVSEDSKAAAVFEFFDGIMGRASSRSCSIDIQHLDVPHLDLDHLTNRFTEAEVWAAIKSMLPDKAPGPDSFSTRFY
jgi:hypothetical protein